MQPQSGSDEDMRPTVESVRVTIDLAGADVISHHGVVRGFSGFTWHKEGTRLVARQVTGVTDGRTCAHCGAPAVLERHEPDGLWYEQCAEHGYAGSWMTPAQFESRLAEMKAAGRSSALIWAFWNWGHRRQRTEPDVTT